MKKNYLCFLCVFAVFQISKAENDLSSATNCNENTNYLYWVGDVDDNFWNEANWRMSNQKPSRDPDQLGRPYCLPGANKKSFQICLGDHNPDKDRVPEAGELDPGVAIQYNLYIEDASLEITGNVSFSCDEKGITFSSSQATLKNQFINGVINLEAESTFYFDVGQESHEGVKYNLLDPGSWFYFYHNDPNELIENASESLYQENILADLRKIRIDQYYQKGSIYRQESTTYKPLKVYNKKGVDGDFSEMPYYDIFQGMSIPNGLNNSISSFILKRGFQVTLAIEENGTSMSKVYIASEEDMVINDLPVALENNISFIRVMPWEWIVKKGTGGNKNGLNAGWYYNWGSGGDSEPNYHYEPMTWGAGPSRPDGIDRIITKKDVNHLLGFNESDNCEDQSGQYNNLCEPAVAVAYFENLMGTGLRVGTPAPRENGPFGWLKEFAEIAKERNVRFDFVAVHWYDWGSNPENSPNAPAQQIFNRFKNYLERVNEQYGLPIWITEFNANPNRGNATQEEFLRLALPYLESIDYVERYAYFEPNPANSNTPNDPAYYYDEAGNLTNIGRLYFGHESTPSIPEFTYEAPNNLEGLDQSFEEKEPNVITFEAECAPYLGNQTILVADGLASNNYYLRLDEEKEGSKDLARQINFEFELEQADSYRLWVRYKSSTGTNTGIIANIDDSEVFQNIGGLNSEDFRWEQLPRFYDLEEGRHRLTIELLNDRFLFDAVALISNSGSVDLIPSAAESCIPPEERWGSNTTDKTYFQEAESAELLGPSWVIGNNEKAEGGEFIKSSLSSKGTPPGDSGYAVYNFDIEDSDEYEIWGKVQALETASDAFWIKIDDGDFVRWDNLKNDNFLWYWNKVYNSYPSEDRKISFFLNAGLHTVTIAYNEANTKIDRVAISSIDKSPAVEDPNVLFQDVDLNFEAEHAILIGNHNIANCDKASNGQQVRPDNASENRIRFEGIPFSKGGIGTLQITYMSANVRKFGLVVNDERLPNQFVEPSGSWCFAGGETAVYEVDVQLRAGENVIEIIGAGDNAPFFDKISFFAGTSQNKTAVQTAPKIEPINTSITSEEVKIAPNPVYSGESIGLLVPNNFDKTVRAEVFDMSGKMIYSEDFQRTNQFFSLKPKLKTGRYILLLLESNGRRTSRNLIVR